jgi:hypothetical protein
MIGVLIDGWVIARKKDLNKSSSHIFRQGRKRHAKYIENVLKRCFNLLIPQMEMISRRCNSL